MSDATLSETNPMLNLSVAKKFLEDLMGKLVRDSTRLGTLTCLIIGGVAILAYILRVIARLPTVGGNWGLDDWVMTASIVRYQLI